MSLIVELMPASDTVASEPHPPEQCPSGDYHKDKENLMVLFSPRNGYGAPLDMVANPSTLRTSRTATSVETDIIQVVHGRENMVDADRFSYCGQSVKREELWTPGRMTGKLARHHSQRQLDLTKCNYIQAR